MIPCFPSTSSSDDFIRHGFDSIDTSSVKSATSRGSTGGKRESRKAADRAANRTASLSGSDESSSPMQPRKRPNFFNVTNTPPCSRGAWSGGVTRFMSPSLTANSMTDRAKEVQSADSAAGSDIRDAPCEDMNPCMLPSNICEYTESRRHGQTRADRIKCLAMAAEAKNIASLKATAAPTRGLPLLTAVRTAFAGVLMGIANLIPGVSGGTMILAMGLYQEFIDSVADVTALRFSWRRVFFLGIVGCCAAGAIVGLAGAILYLLFHYTIAMFSLFIGLTLGGAPLLLKAVRPLRADVIVAALIGLSLMIGVTFMKSDGGFPHNAAMDFASGVVGSTTMILPGISGSYMLLVLDQYDRIVGSVRDLKDGAKGRDWNTLKQSLKIVVPVGVGAVLGIVALSNVLKFLLRNFQRPTVGALLGILLGSVLGLWPFSQSAGVKALEPRSLTELQNYARLRGVEEADALNREALIERLTSAASGKSLKPFPMTKGNVSMTLVLVALGFAATSILSRGGDRNDGPETESPTQAA